MSSRGPEFGCIMDALEAALSAEALTPSRWHPASQALATRPLVPEDTDAEDFRWPLALSH